MATTYVRRVSLKDSLSRAEVIEYWRFLLGEVVPTMQNISGVRSVKLYSGTGGLRADIRLVVEMDDAGVYERVLVDPRFRPLSAKISEAWDWKTANQTFLREMTPELLQAMGSTG